MGSTVDPIAELGLSFIERCANADTQACVDDFLATTRQMGFTAAACAAWVGVGKNRSHQFFFLAGPDGWLEFCNRNRCLERDRLLIEARRHVAPSLCRDVPAGTQWGEQHAFCKAGWTCGLREAFVVPIHGPGSVQGLVTLMTREQRSFSPGEQAILEVMSRTIWQRCRKCEKLWMLAAEPVKLGEREVECLQWVAAGKSDTDIAAIIGISAATVDYHVERAKQRLGVRTRVEAVAIAVANGIV
jgi:DNA-binding CsgD family transcriptional regulator